MSGPSLLGRLLRLVCLAPTVCLVPFVLASCGGGEDAPPTDNPEALVAFEAAGEYWNRPGANLADIDSGVAKLEEAIALDPEFALANVYLANTQSYTYQWWDRTPGRIESSRQAAERAIAIDPEMPEAHAALGWHYYRMTNDHDRALEAFAEVLELDPGNLSGRRAEAYVARRAGEWDRAIELLTAMNADTLTVPTTYELGHTYRRLHRYDEAEATYHQVLELNPEHLGAQSQLAWVAIYRDGDTGPLREFLATQETGYVSARWNLEMFDGNFQEAIAVLEAPGPDPMLGQFALSPRSMLAGFAYWNLRDNANKNVSFQEARTMLEAMLPEHESDPRVHLALGHVYAGLGMNQQAIEAGKKGARIKPPEWDAMSGTYYLFDLAIIYAEVGEAELAVEQLRKLADMPSDVTRPLLSIHKGFDGIRNHPSFVTFMEG